MQHLISWGQYTQYSIITLFAYYAFIALKFYRNELNPQKLFSEIHRKLLFRQSFIAADNEILAQKPSDDHLQTQVNEFSDELTAMLEQLSIQKSNKPHILHSLKKLLRKYPSLNGSSFQAGVNSLIFDDTQSHCDIQICDNELLSLWN